MEKDNVFYGVALTLAAITGFFLRWYLLNDQVLLDDEWHGLYYVIGKSPFWLLTHFSIPGATCIPLNFYTWMAGVTTGYSEIMLRLPALIFGILCVIVCPLLARPVIGVRPAAWLALLLAIAPTLVFYSRIARPYSAMAFLGFAALLFAARWAQTGNRRWAALFIGAGVLAIYFHLFAVVAVLAPLLAAIIHHLYIYFSGKQTPAQVIPPLRYWIIAGLAIAVFSGILILPAVIHLLESKFYNVAFTGALRLSSLPRVLMFLAGTHEPILIVLLLVAVIAGATCQCRRNPWFGWMLLGLFPLYTLAILISKPDSSQSATVLVRYSIPLVPVSLLLAACGIQVAFDAVAKRMAFRPALQGLTALALTAVLVLAGPLPQCYVAPNNFTSHGVYQEFYGQHDWSRSFYSDFTPAGFTWNMVIRADEISPFYVALGQHRNGRPIVEYPMMIGGQFAPFYYYQYFHGRPVIVGYATDVNLPYGLSPGEVYGNTYIDQVLSLVKNPFRLRFRNFICMDDLPAMRARHVEFIILHKHFEAQLDEVTLPLPDLMRLYGLYRKEIGPPVYEDTHIAVFHL